MPKLDKTKLDLFGSTLSGENIFLYHLEDGRTVLIWNTFCSVYVNIPLYEIFDQEGLVKCLGGMEAYEKYARIYELRRFEMDLIRFNDRSKFTTQRKYVRIAMMYLNDRNPFKRSKRYIMCMWYCFLALLQPSTYAR